MMVSENFTPSLSSGSETFFWGGDKGSNHKLTKRTQCSILYITTTNFMLDCINNH